MRIAFHTPQLDVRGTCVSLYDYAHYSETLNGHRSVIVVPASAVNDPMAVVRFARRFEIRTYTGSADLERELADCGLFYCIKYGKRDEAVSLTTKTVVHCVFDLSEPHGDVYAAVSETLACKFGHDLFVPHMIGLRPSKTGESMREFLQIPGGAVVFGRHGGEDTFDLDFAKRAIVRVVRDCPMIYFLFVNTPRFCEHPRVLHLGKIVDLDEKNRFICTCDAMIHAQSLGETFGISCGEFSVNNRPIITYGGKVWNDNYKNILRDAALYFHDEEECYRLLRDFDPVEYRDRDNNCYREYTPEKVMRQFERVFVQ